MAEHKAETTHQEQGETRGFSFRAFYAAVFLFWFGLYTYVPVLSPHATYLGAPLRLVGWIVGSYGLMQMLFRIPAGIASDRLDSRKPFVLLGMLCVAVSGFGLGVVRNPLAMLGFRSLAGLAATMWVIITVLYAAQFPASETAKAMGVITAVLNTATLLASTIGGFLYDWWHPLPFLVGGATGVLGFLTALFFVRDVKQREVEAPRLLDLALVIREPLLLCASLLAVVAQFLTFATVYGFTPVAATNLGATGGQLSMLALCSSLPAVLSSYYSGSFFVPRFGERAVVAGSLLLNGLMAAAIPFVGSLSLLYATQALAGVARGLAFPTLMSLSIKNVTSDKRASAMGFFQAIYAAGMFAGPFIAGLVGDALSLQGAFLVTAAVGLAGALAAVLLLQYTQTKDRTQGVPAQ